MSPQNISSTSFGNTSKTLSLTPERGRSEEHTFELQSPDHLVCRLLLEKKYALWLANALSGRHISACGAPASEACGSRRVVNQLEHILCAYETGCDWPKRTSAVDGWLPP